MGAESKIEWTDHTFNPWSGCSKVHEGCAHCYAEINYSVKMRGVKWGPSGTRVKTANWSEPVKWNKQAACIQTFDCANGDHADCCPQKRRPRVFCASLADVFEDWQGPILDHQGERLLTCDGCGAYYPENAASDSESCEKCGRFKQRMDWTTMNDLRRDLFALIDATPNLDWLLLTKRPENVRRMLVPHSLEKVRGHVSQNEGDGKRIRRRENLRLGTSISLQAHADQQIHELLKCRDLAPVLFLSVEPLLGPVDLHFPPIHWVHPDHEDDGQAAMARIGVEIGGEFLVAKSVSWNNPHTSRWSGDGKWKDGTLVVHGMNRYRLTGWHTPKYGDCDKGIVRIGEFGGINVVINGVRTGNIVGDPVLKWPIAKAPPRAIDWIIVGGESGPKARPCNVEWIRSIRDQCAAAGVPCFIKQLGANIASSDVRVQVAVDDFIDMPELDRRLTDPKGGDWSEWPDDLRVRQFPEEAR